MKNKDNMSKSINNTCREYFMIRTAYTGIIFLSNGRLYYFWNNIGDFFVTFRIESKSDKKFNLTKISIDKMQTINSKK